MELKDRVVVITGGASGIGRAMALRFAAEGARGVVVADRDLGAAQRVADDIDGLAVQVDVGVEADIVQLVDMAKSAYGPIDLFCSNAGIGVKGGPAVPDHEWQQSWDVNLMAHVYAARALLPDMLARGEGYFLQTASAAGLLSQFDAPYAVTKRAAVAFAEWLSITYGDQGVRVSCLCPGRVDTPMLRTESDIRRQLMSRDKTLKPDDVAETVVEGLRHERFLILPHPEILKYMRNKTADIDRWLHSMRKLHAGVDL